MNNRTITLLLLLFSPGIAKASDPTPLLFFAFTQIIGFGWPLAVPLMFLKNMQRKVKAYFVLLLIVYGVIGIISLPIDVYVNFAVWLSLPLDFMWNKFTVISKNLVALICSIVLLRLLSPKFEGVFSD